MIRRRGWGLLVLLILFPLFLFFLGTEVRAETGTLKLSILEEATRQSVPARVHLAGPKGAVQAPDLPFFRDHFNCEGQVTLSLESGEYRYTVERGPEYRRVSAKLKVAAGEEKTETVFLERWIDLAARGWWSGEMHVHRPVEDMGLLLRSEDLHVAPVLTVWNQNNLWRERALPATRVVEPEPGRFYHLLACEDERRGGALLFFNLTEPLDFQGGRPEFPSPMVHVAAARRQRGAWIDVEKPFWWDVPVWVASGQVDSMGLANNHMCRSTMYKSEAWGRPRDADRLPPPRGNGFFSQEIYYRLLNCGFRIPPSAGSASGVLPNPLGYNRVYVKLEEKMSYQGWWEGVRAGRTFVTNGPILLVEANGKLPGTVFQPKGEAPVSINVNVKLGGNDPMESIDVVKDGKVLSDSLRPVPGDSSKSGLGVWKGKVAFERSGWFLVRAIARVPGTFRFASTAPFYVEVGSSPSTVYREDVQFFLDWIDERVRRIKHAGPEAFGSGADAPRPQRLGSVLEPQQRARWVFEGLLERALPGT